MKIKSSKKYPLTPMGKPAIGPSIWSVAAKRFYRFRDNVKMLAMKLSFGSSWVTFRIPMPKSWAKCKKERMDGRPHQQKPDLDNLMKALGDAIYSDDAGIWRI